MMIFGAVFKLLIMAFLVFILPYSVWYLNRKNGMLDNEERIAKKLNKSLSSAFWNFVAYMVTFTILILANYGASMIADKIPAWKIPLTLLIIFTAIAANVWLAIIPSLKVGYNFIIYLALLINIFIKKEFPLNYYASKPGNRNSRWGNSE